MRSTRRPSRNFARLRAAAPLVEEVAPSLYVYRLRMGDHEQIGRGRVLLRRRVRARRHPQARAHAQGQGGRPDPAHPRPARPDRPRLPDLPGLRRRGSSRSRRRSRSRRSSTSPPPTASSTRSGARRGADRGRPGRGLRRGSRCSTSRTAITARRARCAPGKRCASSARRRDRSRRTRSSPSRSRTTRRSSCRTTASSRTWPVTTPASFLEALRRAHQRRRPGRTRPPDPARWRCTSPASGTRCTWPRLRPERPRQTAWTSQLLHDQVLAPLLGVGDPRTDKRIDFIGGIRGPGALVRRASTRAAPPSRSRCTRSASRT